MKLKVFLWILCHSIWFCFESKHVPPVFKTFAFYLKYSLLRTRNHWWWHSERLTSWIKNSLCQHTILMRKRDFASGIRSQDSSNIFSLYGVQIAKHSKRESRKPVDRVVMGTYNCDLFLLIYGRRNWNYSMFIWIYMQFNCIIKCPINIHLSRTFVKFLGLEWNRENINTR